MATRQKPEIPDDFKPKSIDIDVDFVRHSTPISSIQIDHLREALKAPETGHDIGVRKEALIMDFPSGRIIIAANGLIAARFRSTSMKQALDLLTSLINYLCRTFDWVAKDEIFTIHVDLVDEVTGSSPVRALLKGADLKYLTNMVALEKGQKIHAVGYTFFLSELGERHNDFRVRVEPLSAEPQRKFFVRITNVKRETSFEKLGEILSEMAAHALRIAAQLKEMKA